MNFSKHNKTLILHEEIFLNIKKTQKLQNDIFLLVNVFICIKKIIIFIL